MLSDATATSVTASAPDSLQYYCKFNMHKAHQIFVTNSARMIGIFLPPYTLSSKEVTSSTTRNKNGS
jgi:hypothetical protein